MNHGVGRRTVIGALIGSVAVAGLMTVPAQAASPRVAVTDKFSAVVPTRILDTRTGLGLPGSVPAAVGTGGVVTLHVAGQAGVPASVDAVVMNVTGVLPSKGTYVSVYPADLSSPPAISNLNIAAGKVVPNLVTVQVDGAGDVKLFNAFGTINLVADVTGFYASSGTDTYTPVTPTRILDTRDGTGVPAPAFVGPGGTIDLNIQNNVSVNPPIPSNASAVVLNVTAVGATRGTYIQVYPKPDTIGGPPTVSNLNVVPGQAVANLVTVGVGADGSVRLRNAYGNVDLVADVAGYFTPDNNGSLYTPVTPVRLLDSRGNPPTVTKTPVGPGGVIDLQLTGNAGMPDDATAAIFNYTAVLPTLPTYVQASPAPASGNPIPATSNINLAAGEVRANLAAVQLGAGGDVRLRNQAGITNLVVDLAGYYTNAGAPNVPGPPPVGAPGPEGVTISASFINVHPSPYGKASLNVTTNVDSDKVTATALFRSGPVKLQGTSTAGTPLLFTFGIGANPAGVNVPVLITAHSAALGATATATAVFAPVPLSCRAAASPVNPAQHTTVDIVVGTAPGADIATVFHFKATTPTQNSHAEKTGRGDVMRDIGGATVGYRVVVSVTVTLGPTKSSCATAFTPIA